MKKTQRGLSLIELMIVLAAAAVIATIAVPSMGAFVQESRVTSMSNHLVANLRYARHEAVFRRANVVACPGDEQAGCTGSNRWDQGWIVFIDANDSRQPDRPEDILRVVAPDERMLMHSAGRNRVRFQPHGGAYGTNLTIRVCDTSQLAQPRAVIVSNPGRVRVDRDLDTEECNV